jgi:hypothetical protein
MHRHAQPIRRFFTPHRLNALSTSTHVVSVAHGREHAGQQPEMQRQIFIQRKRPSSTRGEPTQVNAVFREPPQDTVLYQGEITSP